MKAQVALLLVVVALSAGGCARTTHIALSTPNPNVFVPRGPAGSLARLEITGPLEPELCGERQGSGDFTFCLSNFETAMRGSLEAAFQEWFQGEGPAYTAELHVQEFYVRMACSGSSNCTWQPILEYRFRLLRADGTVVVQMSRTGRAPRHFGTSSESKQTSMDSLVNQILETIIGSLPNVQS